MVVDVRNALAVCFAIATITLTGIFYFVASSLQTAPQPLDFVTQQTHQCFFP